MVTTGIPAACACLIMALANPFYRMANGRSPLLRVAKLQISPKIAHFCHYKNNLI
jgi:hypothetical protein